MIGYPDTAHVSRREVMKHCRLPRCEPLLTALTFWMSCCLCPELAEREYDGETLVDDERAPLLDPAKEDDCEQPLAVSIEDSPGGYIVVHTISGPNICIPMAVASMPPTSSRAGDEQGPTLPTRPISPCLGVFEPSLRPTPSPPPPPSPSPSHTMLRDSWRRRRVHSSVLVSQGDSVLINLLGNGRNPDVAIRAGRELLPPLDNVPRGETFSRFHSLCGRLIDAIFQRVLSRSCTASAAASEDDSTNDLQGESPDQTSDDGMLDLDEQPERLSSWFAPGGCPESARKRGRPTTPLGHHSGCPGGLHTSRSPARSKPLLREWREGSPRILDSTSARA